jgi:acyl-coenzyme A synthetase/AMP-(fatty) acid ligase
LAWLAAERPRRIAADHPGGPAWTWNDVACEVARLRAQLLGSRRALVRLTPGPHYLAGVLAAAACGTAIVAPPNWRQEEQARALGVLGPELQPDAVLESGADGGTEIAVAREQVAANKPTVPADPLLVQFTSGTTGRPRAVARRLDDVLAEARAYAAAVHLSESDVVATTTSLHHSYAFGVGMMAAFAAGARLVPLPANRPPRLLLRALAQARPTVLCSVPAVYRLLAATSAPDQRSACGSARLLVSAGSPASAALRQQLEQGLSAPLTNLYGTTETGAIACERPGAVGGAGAALPGIKIEVRAEHQSLAVGQVGEVFVRSPYAASEYVGLGGGGVFQHGWVRTRDRGWFNAGGCLHLAGRVDDVINVGGQKVDPLEVEEVLGRLAGVEEVVVLRVEEADEDRVAAVFRAARPIGLDEVRCFARQRLSDYKAPLFVRCVAEIPRGPTGKVSRTELARLFFEDPGR